MAKLRIPEQGRVLEDYQEIRQYLATIGIGYEVWKASCPLDPKASNEQILEAYSQDIERLKAEGGYQSADVINLFPDTPNLDSMLERFRKEHWHNEDEIRFITAGRGVFHIRPKEGGPVVALEVEEGDLARVPAGTWHWFDLCKDQRIRAIRLFQDPSGWTPHYTESGLEQGFMPLCFGLDYIPSQLQSL